MKSRLLLLACAILFPVLTVAAPDIDGAVRDICKCGFPPSSSCIEKLAKKYPEIDRRPDLQERVMGEAQNKCGMGSPDAEAAIRDMVGNQNLDTSSLPSGVAEALSGISGVISVTQDCSTNSFMVVIPEGWQCRKLQTNPQDVTLYTNGNRLNVTLGINQGMTSCNVIPNCSTEDFELSDKFETKLYKNPIVDTYEYAGIYKKNDAYKLTITSTTKPTASHLRQIIEILDSFEQR